LWIDLTKTRGRIKPHDTNSVAVPVTPEVKMTTDPSLWDRKLRGRHSAQCACDGTACGATHVT